MTIEQTNVVDFIYIDSTTDEVVLNISDHLPWEGNDEHIFLLQDKINTYLSFVESGEILESFPKAVGRSVAMKVICKYPPSQLAKKFFDNAGIVVRDAGFRLSFEVAAEN